MPVPSLSLKAINVIQPTVPATYSNQPSTPPNNDSKLDPILETFENFEKTEISEDFRPLQSSFNSDTGEAGEPIYSSEIERSDENENEEFENSDGIARSASTIISSAIPTTPTPPSPASLLSKSKSGTSLPKSKSGSHMIPKKKKNKSILFHYFLFL